MFFPVSSSHRSVTLDCKAPLLATLSGQLPKNPDTLISGIKVGSYTDWQEVYKEIDEKKHEGLKINALVYGTLASYDRLDFGPQIKEEEVENILIEVIKNAELLSKNSSLEESYKNHFSNLSHDCKIRLNCLRQAREKLSGPITCNKLIEFHKIFLQRIKIPEERRTIYDYNSLNTIGFASFLRNEDSFKRRYSPIDGDPDYKAEEGFDGPKEAGAFYETDYLKISEKLYCVGISYMKKIQEKVESRESKESEEGLAIIEAFKRKTPGYLSHARIAMEQVKRKLSDQAWGLKRTSQTEKRYTPDDFRLGKRPKKEKIYSKKVKYPKVVLKFSGAPGTSPEVAPSFSPSVQEYDSQLNMSVSHEAMDVSKASGSGFAGSSFTVSDDDSDVEILETQEHPLAFMFVNQVVLEQEEGGTYNWPGHASFTEAGLRRFLAQNNDYINKPILGKGSPWEWVLGQLITELEEETLSAPERQHYNKLLKSFTIMLESTSDKKLVNPETGDTCFHLLFNSTKKVPIRLLSTILQNRQSDLLEKNKKGISPVYLLLNLEKESLYDIINKCCELSSNTELDFQKLFKDLLEYISAFSDALQISLDNYFQARILFALLSGNIENLLKLEETNDFSIDADTITENEAICKSVKRIISSLWKDGCKLELAIKLKEANFSNFLDDEAKKEYLTLKQILLK